METESITQLRRALDEDQLVLYCQPIRALAAGDYPLAEVLVRLQEEEQALLPPGEFLPVFEHYRMMPELDRWVVRHTAQKIAAGSRIARFSVNVAGQTLADPRFPSFVAETLRAAGVPADAMLFEIDETDFFTQTETSARFAAELKRIGCGVMLDGFGRKAVSFAPLKSIRADYIKVDGSITRRILSSDGAASKVKATVRVSHTLGIGVVAECVEDQDILLRLKAMGVGFAQGFGILEPRSIDSQRR